MAFKRMGNYRIDEWCHGDRDRYVRWNLSMVGGVLCGTAVECDPFAAATKNRQPRNQGLNWSL
jgi:hypothetical protein